MPSPTAPAIDSRPAKKGCAVPLPHPPYPHQPSSPTATLNPFAVTALVTSLLCLAPLGLVFGIVALVQIARRGQRGKGLAIAGVTVSGAVLLLAGIAAAVVDFRVWTPPARDTTGEVVKPGWTTFHSIEPGDCFTPRSGLPGRDAPPTPGADVRLVPCGAPHRGEAYATFRLPEQDQVTPPWPPSRTRWTDCTEHAEVVA